MNDTEYAYLRKVLLKLINIDINQYKSKQMRRRLESFIQRRKPLNIAAYCRDLERDPQLLQALRDFLTINVSQFFRDQPQFTNLKSLILPQLFKRRSRLNIWSAGCSNGAEPYSIAIILKEMYPSRKHRILATDMDNTVLRVARNGGPYASRDVQNVEDHLLEKYFVTSNDAYWLTDDIKLAVRFKQHNLLTDPYEGNFDLILCRNVVIYFTEETKRKLNIGFHNALRPGGVLFVGGSEIIMRESGVGFESICPYFYRRSHDKVLTHA